MIKKTIKMLLMSCCGWFISAQATEDLQSFTYDVLEHKATSEFIAEMGRDLQLTSKGHTSINSNDIKKIIVSLECKQSAGINEARRIAVLALDHLRRKVNSKRELRPYLREYPFPISGARLFFSFPKTPQQTSQETISRIFLDEGRINYYPIEDKQPACLQESYEQALAIIQKKYPADFPSNKEEDKPGVSLSFTDNRDLSFDDLAEVKTAEMIQSFNIPLHELDELAILGLQATHSKNLATILKDLTRNIVTPHFDEAFLQRVHDFQRAHPDGEYIEYWGNGQMKFRGYFKEGMPDQHFHGWYSNGQDAFKGFFENGKPIGVHIAFFPLFPSLGKSNFEGRVLAYNEQGELHGSQKIYSPKGVPLSVIRYVTGLLDGKVTIWKEKKVVTKEHYQNGILISWTNKEIVAEREYKKGQLVTPTKS